jgi:methionyl-tRNA formyltransferase
MTNHTHFIVACVKPWNRRVFDEIITSYPGVWHFVGRSDELTPEKVAEINPRFIFFLHWSEKVPPEILSAFECVCFHMTEVPYGRGGSPLQNLIVRGHRRTKLSALRMVAEFDAGPVYMQEELSLEGGAEEIYIRSSYLSARMIQKMIEQQPLPEPQMGEVTVFKRRKPSESQIPSLSSLQSLHDFIRMLDAEGYPHAFLEHQGFCYEFKRAALYDGRIVADVIITSIREKDPS